MKLKRPDRPAIQRSSGGHTGYSPGQIPGLRITAGIALSMASTSSPRKTPSARKRAAPRPTAPDLVEAPVTATPDAPPDLPPAAATARKRAPRKTSARAAARPVETEASPVVVVVVEAAPVDVPAAAAPAEPAVAAPAKKTARRTPARKKAAAPASEPVAQAVAEPAPASEPLPETAVEPTPVAAPAPVPEPAPAPAAEEAPAPPPPDLRPPHSSVTLQPGVRQQLHWVAGRGCPPELDAAAQALGTPTDAAPLVNDLALVDLVRLARERRHTLQVDEAVWDWLAQARDMRARVAHLESSHPAGPLSPALAALVTGTLRPYQAEGALYAACAGRSLLADDAGLGKTVQAIAAVRLIGQSFGAARRWCCARPSGWRTGTRSGNSGPAPPPSRWTRGPPPTPTRRSPP